MVQIPRDLTATLTEVWVFISTNKMLIKPLNKSDTLYSSWNMVQLTIWSFSTWRVSLAFYVLALAIGPPSPSSPSKGSLPLFLVLSSSLCQHCKQTFRCTCACITHPHALVLWSHTCACDVHPHALMLWQLEQRNVESVWQHTTHVAERHVET